MDKKFHKVLQDLQAKNRIPDAIKEKHEDIEGAIVARGGRRGSLRHADV